MWLRDQIRKQESLCKVKLLKVPLALALAPCSVPALFRYPTSKRQESSWSFYSQFRKLLWE